MPVSDKEKIFLIIYFRGLHLNNKNTQKGKSFTIYRLSNEIGEHGRSAAQDAI